MADLGTGIRRLMRMRLTLGRGIVLAAFAVVIAALVVASSLLLRQSQQASAVATSRDSAQDAAKTIVPRVLSYSYQTLTADIANATAAATGDFKQNLQSLMTQMVQPTATSEDVVTRATVTRAAVVDARPDEMILLVLLSQESTSKTQQTPVVSASSARVQLRQVDGQWLVADLQPL